jgi:hypothetical protein
LFISAVDDWKTGQSGFGHAVNHYAQGLVGVSDYYHLAGHIAERLIAGVVGGEQFLQVFSGDNAA